jgi:hypothetical protein
MAKDLTPKEFKCSYGASCPSVHELEDGRLLIVGRLSQFEAKELGINWSAGEVPILIERGLLDKVLKCQASDSETGIGSAPSAFQSDEFAEALQIIAALTDGGEDLDEMLRQSLSKPSGQPAESIDVTHPEERRAREFLKKHQRSIDEGCKPDERTADSAEATKPCHRCGSGGLTYSSSGNGKPGRTIICRSCGWQASFDTPERGSTNQETNRIRKASGFAQWNRASAADMQPRSRILRGPIEEAQRADTATAASDAVSLTSNSTPQEAPAGPGDDNGE